jgi:hypothetical protein
MPDSLPDSEGMENLDKEEERLSERDYLLGLSARQHLLKAAMVPMPKEGVLTQALILQELRVQTHLLWSIAKNLDKSVSR